MVSREAVLAPDVQKGFHAHVICQRTQQVILDTPVHGFLMVVGVDGAVVLLQHEAFNECYSDMMQTSQRQVTAIHT
jgi:hypothetical protein